MLRFDVEIRGFVRMASYIYFNLKCRFLDTPHCPRAFPYTLKFSLSVIFKCLGMKLLKMYTAAKRVKEKQGRYERHF